MKKTFIESTSFTEGVQEFLGDEAYFAFQNELMDQPDQATGTCWFTKVV